MIATLTLAAALLVGADDGAQGRPFLDPLFSGHAVLQRDVPIPFRGWTEAGQRVKVAFAGQSVETTANASGLWTARLGPFPAGGPYTLLVSGPKMEVEAGDILIGDVWLCSGQSNMEWSVDRSDRPRQEIAAADHPRIRLITVPKKVATAPTATIDVRWEVCSPATVPDFSAVGYFFGRDLRRELDVPIGLIDSTWGGTVAEAWTSARALDSMDDFRRGLAEIRREADADQKAPTSFAQAMAAWWAKNDPGSQEQPTWADPGYDASAWKSMDLPGNWETKGLPDFDGLLWYRKEVDLPEGWEGKAARLDLGPIDDRDTTFVNGKAVGGMNVWLTGRSYKVPEGLLKAGRNVIAVRVLDTSGLGGFVGGKDALKLSGPADAKLDPVSLAGPWSYKEAAAMSNLSTPPEPDGSGPNRVTVLHNGMIAPLGAFPIKGATWYQGESNASRAGQYRTLLPTLIRDWRSQFGVGDFPFLIVQLANYQKRREQPVDSAWAELREAQFLATRALPNVGVALAIDIGDAGDIHPTNKQEVGRRLALAALAMTYGKGDVEPSGPVYKGMAVEGRAARLSFDHLGGGLVAKGDGPLEGFAVAGEDGKFAWADAKIEGDTVLVSSADVEKPATVRYAWADNPACNLYNQSGLPAVPFRTDAPPK